MIKMNNMIKMINMINMIKMNNFYYKIKIYGAHARPEREKFILKYQVVRGREYTDTLEGMERIRFIDRIGIDLFDLYFEYLERPDFNIIRYGQDTYLEMRFNEIEHINML